MRSEEICGWGRRPRRWAKLTAARPEQLFETLKREAGPLLPRGAGMSYGDASLGAHVFTTATSGALVFSEDEQKVEVDAGVTMLELCRGALAKGRFPIVLPGTRYATVGGCLAADVHGKNHVEAGSFGRHVEAFELWTADGTKLHCTSTENAEIFHATLGGMGATGLIGAVRLRLMPVPGAYWLETLHLGRDLEALLLELDETPRDEHVVGWIDPQARGRHLGRGYLERGRPGPGEGEGSDRVPARVPFDPPFSLLSPRLVAAANELIYTRARVLAKRGPRRVHYSETHWPFDVLGDWNRLYGPHGFVQIHFVVPRRESRVLSWALERAQRVVGGAFAGVLKRLGPESPGPLSFPMEGLSLALDLPAGEGLRELAGEIHLRVAAAGGRVYLAKDAMLEPEVFAAMYPRAHELAELKARIDPARRFLGDQAARLGLFRD